MATPSSENSAVSYNFIFHDDPEEVRSNTWYGNNTNFLVTASNDLFSNGMWRHVTVSFDHLTGVKSLYVDGTLVDQADRPDEPFVPADNTRITIGTYWGSCGCLANWFDGMIDELRIYDRPLAEGEIAKLVALKPCPADFTADGEVNTLDVLAFLNAWSAGCP